MPQLIHDSRSPATLRDLLIAQAPAALARAGEMLVAHERSMQASPTQAAGIAYADAVHRWSELGGYDLEVSWNAACMVAMAEYALWNYEGTILAVTHDRWLLKSFQRFLVFGSDGWVKESDDPTWI